MAGPGRVSKTKKQAYFICIPAKKKYVGEVGFLSAARWATSAEALSYGKDLRNQCGRRFALKTTVQEF